MVAVQSRRLGAEPQEALGSRAYELAAVQAAPSATQGASRSIKHVPSHPQPYDIGAGDAAWERAAVGKRDSPGGLVQIIEEVG